MISGCNNSFKVTSFLAIRINILLQNLKKNREKTKKMKNRQKEAQIRDLLLPIYGEKMMQSAD